MIIYMGIRFIFKNQNDTCRILNVKLIGFERGNGIGNVESST